MNYTKITFATSDRETQEKIIAELAESISITGFEELEDCLIAYGNSNVDVVIIQEIADSFSISYNTEAIEDKNWNEVWENNFEPVLIDDFCYIYADFHPVKDNVKYQINITPKMSFGTGHHATTRMMIKLMRDIDFNNKKALDFGTGTGVLSILAEQLSASHVDAVDNDIWSYENALENCARNGTTKTLVKQGSLNLYSGQVYDIILANINRNILLDHMIDMAILLHSNGDILLSGILAIDDETVIKNAAKAQGLEFKNQLVQDKWTAMHFKKS